MGHSLKEVSSFVPQHIKETHFFQECISALPHLSSGVTDKEGNVIPGNIDHYGVEVCWQQTGRLLSDTKWVQNHPRFAELSAYSQKILKLNHQSPEEAILFSKGALEMLDAGRTMSEAARLALSLQYAVKYSKITPMTLAKAENLLPESIRNIPENPQVSPVEAPDLVAHEEVKSENKDRTVRISEPMVLKGKIPQTSAPAQRFEKDLRKLSKAEMISLQESCVQIQTQHFIDQGMSPENAKKQALSLLGATGVDGKYGSKTRQLLSNVLLILSEDKRINVADIKSVQVLNSALHAESLRGFVKQALKESA